MSMDTLADYKTSFVTAIDMKVLCLCQCDMETKCLKCHAVFPQDNVVMSPTCYGNKMFQMSCCFFTGQYRDVSYLRSAERETAVCGCKFPVFQRRAVSLSL